MKFWLMIRLVRGGDVLYSSRLIAHERAPAQKLAGARGIYNQMLLTLLLYSTLLPQELEPFDGTEGLRAIA